MVPMCCICAENNCLMGIVAYDSSNQLGHSNGYDWQREVTEKLQQLLIIDWIALLLDWTVQQFCKVIWIM